MGGYRCVFMFCTGWSRIRWAIAWTLCFQSVPPTPPTSAGYWHMLCKCVCMCTCTVYAGFAYAFMYMHVYNICTCRSDLFLYLSELLLYNHFACSRTVYIYTHTCMCVHLCVWAGSHVTLLSLVSRSQYPSQMMSVLLNHTLSFPYLPTLTPPQPAPHSFTSLTQALTYLTRAHRDHLKQATIDSLTRILSGGPGATTAESVRMLLVVATHCPPLTQFVAMDCLHFSKHLIN